MRLVVGRNSVFLMTLLSFLILLSILFDNDVVSLINATLIFFIIIKVVNPLSPIHIMFLVGFSVFIYFPAMMNFYFFKTSLDLFFATSFVSLFFLLLTSKIIYNQIKYTSRSYLFFFLFFSIIVVLSSFLKFSAIYFLSPLVMFYVLCMKPKHYIYNISLSLLFLLVFFIYLLVGWNGFGRTVTFGMLITAILYFLYVNEIRFNKLIFALFPVLGSMLLVSRRDFSFSINPNDVVNDSAVGPYRLASTFIDNYIINGFDAIGFFDQIVFTIFVFIPRDLWPSKPNGFGFQYVVDNMGQSFVDEGHSIASTLIGDHIYFLGWWGVFTSLLMMYMLFRICLYINNMKLFQGFGIVLIACNIMVFVWGGMTSFSARIIFPMLSIIPFFLLYGLFVILKNRRF